MSRVNNLPELYRCDGNFERSNVEVRRKNFSGSSVLHWHDYYELELFCEGTGEYNINNQSFPLGRGSCYLVTPADFHDITAENAVVYNVAFNSSVLDWSLTDRINQCEMATVHQLTEEELDMILPLLDLLTKEYDKDNPDRERMLKNLLECLVLMFLRRSEKGKTNDRPKSSNVMKAVSYIRFNFKKQFTLRDVAKEIGITPNYLGSCFKKEMDMTFHQYLMETRLQYAHQLLKDKDLTIKQIAHESGFVSWSYFSDSFHKRFGYAPNTMRQTLKKQKDKNRR